MENNSDKNRLMAYLYGELSPKEMKEVEQELGQNTELDKDEKDFKRLREYLGCLEDQSSIPPPLLLPARTVSIWSKSAVRLVAILGIIAGLLIFTAKVTGLSVFSNSNGLLITFGNKGQFMESDGQLIPNVSATSVGLEARIQNIEKLLDQERLVSKKILDQLSEGYQVPESLVRKELDLLGKNITNKLKVAIENGQAINKEYYKKLVDELGEEQLLQSNEILKVMMAEMKDIREYDLFYLQMVLAGIEADKENLLAETNKYLSDHYYLNGNLKHE